MDKIYHWSDNVTEMTFDEFREFHKLLIESEDELKRLYKLATGKDPEKKKGRNEKPSSTESEA